MGYVELISDKIPLIQRQVVGMPKPQNDRVSPAYTWRKGNAEKSRRISFTGALRDVIRYANLDIGNGNFLARVTAGYRHSPSQNQGFPVTKLNNDNGRDT